MSETETKTKVKKPKKPATERQAILAILAGVFVVGVGFGVGLVGVGATLDAWQGEGDGQGASYIVPGVLTMVIGLVLIKSAPRPFRSEWIKRFSKDVTAVSPVIAVILMVAITVVLAAVVFVLVSDIGANQAGAAPTIGFRADEVQDRLGVEAASLNADWSRLDVRADVAGVRFALNTNAGSTSQSADTYAKPTTAPTSVKAGDYLDFCGPTTGATVTIRDAAANVIVFEARFSDLVACA